MEFRKVVSMVLGVAILSSCLMVGCTKKESNSNGSSASGSEATQKETAEKAKEPDEISIFYGTAGLKFPEGVGPGDNTYIKKIAELANVKFKEVTVPEYADFQTKFNLMVSSGSIPDFVHCWYPTDVQQHGASGAFLEMNDIIANSPVLSKAYTSSMINLMKDNNGKIYALRTLPPLDTDAAFTTPWLMDELNDGKIPVTPEEWYQLFKKEKEKYPDSVPFSAIGGLDCLELFFKAHGAAIRGGGVEWQYHDGKIINAFEAPLCKDAVIYYNKLYKEGLLDKTFVTNKGEEWHDRIDNKKMLLGSNNLNSTYGLKSVPAPLPRINDPRVTDDDAYYAMQLLGSHCVSIGASTKNKDAVVRFIEVLLSDEVRELSTWGIKDVDYTEVNGKKTLTEKSTDTFALRMMYRIMFTYGSAESVEMATSSLIAKQDESYREKYEKYLKDGLNVSYEQAKKAKPSPVSYIQLSPDTQSKYKEAQEASKPILVKAILGEISMQEYDTQVATFLKKYQFITDEYNQKLPAMMELLK